VQQLGHLRTDLAEADDVERTSRRFADGHGALVDAAVFAAGVDSNQGISDLDPAAFARAMQINCVAHLRLLGGVLAARQVGSDPLRVCMVSSDVVGRPTARTAVYAASKAALEEALRHVTADIPMALLLIRLPYIGQPMRECAEGGAGLPPSEPAHGATLGGVTSKVTYFLGNTATTGALIEVWP
jgi:NAD(P)-dependent dehydrogenase (short-subunit alcohol dehydrogenase family)